MNYGKRKPIEITSDVEKIDTCLWRGSVEVNTGDTVRFRIYLRNTSKYVIPDVIIRDILPEGFVFVGGSTMICDAKHPSGVKVKDGIADIGGYKLGNFDTKKSISIYFNAYVNCGKSILCNTARVAADFPNSLNESNTYVIVN